MNYHGYERKPTTMSDKENGKWVEQETYEGGRKHSDLYLGSAG